jgi:hypothetical protein
MGHGPTPDSVRTVPPNRPLHSIVMATPDTSSKVIIIMIYHGFNIHNSCYLLVCYQRRDGGGGRRKWWRGKQQRRRLTCLGTRRGISLPSSRRSSISCRYCPQTHIHTSRKLGT